MTDQNRCSQCQSPLAPGALFCSRCGFDVSGVQGGLATAKVAVAADPEDPQAGLLEELRRATLGDFDIAGELGRGGMATVFLAHEIALDRKVAIKVMSPALLQGGRGMADRFKREARTAAALSHPHIIPIFGVRESGRLLFFVMKFVHGRSLDAITKEHGPLPIKMVQAILAQAGSALDYAHRHHVIHRDIKPANIMLDVEGWAVLTDFGIAKVTEAQGLTMTGATIGTPTYMSPEQCAAKEITGATDQYSLGVTAYEMITGKVPFDADSMMSLMWQHFHEPPPPILERRSDCPPDLAQAIERMLAKKPEDRWPTLEDAVEAIGNPPLNDPIRLQMKALARGGSVADAAQRHTPVSPVPTHAGPPTAGPATPRPSAPAPVATAAPTTPIPVTPTGAAPPTPLPITPVMPIAPPTPPEITESPTAVFVTPVPAPPRARPPAPPTPPPATPAPPKRSEPRRASRAEPAPAIPPPFTPVRRGGPLRVAGTVAVLAAAGVVAWMLFGRGRSTGPEPSPVVPATIEPVASVAVAPSPASIIVGGTTQLTATLKDARGALLTGREVSWASSDTTMARVSPSGVVQGLQPGYINITATSGDRSGTGTVLVTATVTPVAAVEIAPTRAAVPLGDSVALSAAAKDTRGNTLSGRAVKWTSSDPTVASVSPGGVVQPRREGTTAISATIEGKSATWRLTITQPVVAAVAVTPSAVPLQVGGRTQLTAAARDARGNAIRGRTVTWSTSDRTLATVSPEGAVAALRPGLVIITARIDAESASAAVTVTAIPVASVSVTPATLTVAVGRTAQLAASMRDARNVVMTDREVRWASSNTAVATVSTNGTVTGVDGGTATITATSEDKVGRATVTVPAPPPAVVDLPETPTPQEPKPAPAKPVAQQPAEPQPPAPDPAPVDAAAATRTLPRREVAVGGAHACALTQADAAVCWGNNAAGQLGDASVGATSATPTLVAHAAGFTSLVAGNDFTCGLTPSGSAVCWGLNSKGQLGSGRTAGAPTPVAVAGGRTYTRLAAGARHACGLVSDGTVWCWGDNGAGQLGDGTTRGANAPRRVRGDTKFKAVAAGSDHTCALSQNGQAFCWGDGFSGQIGRGARESQPEPVPAETDLRFTTLAAGGTHTCTLMQSGKAYCWGSNVAGEIGDGSKDERLRPVAVSGTRVFTAIAAGNEHTCALTQGGDAYCWGRNRDGQLGDGGARSDRPAPVKVAFSEALRDIGAGATHSCGVTRGQEVVCWGSNGRGQLGDGTVTGRPTPAAVRAGADRRP
ncbi:MAG: protein kinase domain-containing protein [Gemmatimonadales bacterium]